MVDYSKWDNLDSGSDSDSEPVNTTTRSTRAVTPTRSQPVKSKDAAGSSRSRALYNQVESLRLQGNDAFERGDLPAAMGAYDAQLRLLDGKTDKQSVEALCAALLNQASALIRMRKFADAEARCTALLTATGGQDNAAAANYSVLRTRAKHFRGFSRLRQGKHDEACLDLRDAVSAGVGNAEEASALLMEAEAGSALSNCRDPEAKGRDQTATKPAVAVDAAAEGTGRD